MGDEKARIGLFRRPGEHDNLTMTRSQPFYLYNSGRQGDDAIGIALHVVGSVPRAYRRYQKESAGRGEQMSGRSAGNNTFSASAKLEELLRRTIRRASRRLASP